MPASFFGVSERGGIFSESNTGRGVKPDALRSTECHLYQSRIPTDSSFKLIAYFTKLLGFIGMDFGVTAELLIDICVCLVEK